MTVQNLSTLDRDMCQPLGRILEEAFSDGLVAEYNPSGSVASDQIRMEIVDVSTPSTGYTRGLYLKCDQNGAKTGDAEFNGLAVDVTVAASAPYVFPVSIYTGECGEATVSSLSGIYMYMDDIGASATVNHKCALDLNIDNGDDATICAFMRMYNHGGEIDAALYFANAGVGTVNNLLKVGCTGGFLAIKATALDTLTSSHRILIDIAGTPGYIPIMTSWS